MTTTLPTRAQIDAAPDLDFDEKSQPKKKAPRAVMINLAYHGAPVAFHFAAAENITVEDIERSIDAMLKRGGWTTPPLPSAPEKTAKPPRPTMEPIYSASGEACCPVHKKVLQEGKFGLFCSAKAKEGEAQNDKGYCALRFL